jgi:Flp pilus assembly pilin Flp
MLEMHMLWSQLLKLRQEESGQDLLEYALTASFIAVAVAAIFPTTIAPDICTVFSKVLSCMQKTP